MLLVTACRVTPGWKGSPALAQSQQGSPVPTLAAMPWKIVLMWGLRRESAQVSGRGAGPTRRPNLQVNQWEAAHCPI